MEYIDIDKVQVGDRIQNGGTWYSVVATARGAWRFAVELRETETDPQTIVVEYDIYKGNTTMTQVLVKRSHAD